MRRKEKVGYRPGLGSKGGGGVVTRKEKVGYNSTGRALSLVGGGEGVSSREKWGFLSQHLYCLYARVKTWENARGLYSVVGTNSSIYCI